LRPGAAAARIIQVSIPDLSTVKAKLAALDEQARRLKAEQLRMGDEIRRIKTVLIRLSQPK